MRDRRFHARGRYRLPGLLLCALGALMLVALLALWDRWRAGGSPLNLLGALICAGAAGLFLWLGWQIARPQLLILTSQGGALQRPGVRSRTWRWVEADRVEWLKPWRSGFVTPEPFLVLKGYVDDQVHGSEYLIPLAPFSEIAYAVIRERLLLNTT